MSHGSRMVADAPSIRQLARPKRNLPKAGLREPTEPEQFVTHAGPPVHGVLARQSATITPQATRAPLFPVGLVT